MKSILIRGGRIIDPSQNIDVEGNLLIRDGRVVGINSGTTVADELIDATGRIVCPGLIDAHASLREPGNEEDETTATGTAAAVAGGFTTLASMPDTSPSVDNRASAEFIALQADRAGHCHVVPLGAVTKANAGQELAEIGQLVEGGAVGFTDAKKPIANAEVMRRALEYTRMFDRPILHYPQVPELIEGGVMHEGFHSTLLGLKGMPIAAEDIMVGRDIALAEMTGGCLHLMCISTAHGVDRIRRAKSQGIRVSADVTPHHLVFTDEQLRSFDTNFKVAPPLRPTDHVETLIAGLKDGTIEIICADHQPYAEEKKDGGLNEVPFGISGLETLIPICRQALIAPGHLSWPELIAKLTIGPAKLLGIAKGTLAAGADADVTIIDPEAEWTVDTAQFRSRGKNNPWNGWIVKGRATMVIVGGAIRYRVLVEGPKERIIPPMGENRSL